MSLAPKSFMRCSSKRNSNRQLKSQLGKLKSENVAFKNQRIISSKKQQNLHIIKDSSQKSIKNLSRKKFRSIPILTNISDLRQGPTIVEQRNNRYNIIYKHKSQQLQCTTQNLNFMIHNPQRSATYEKIHSDRGQNFRKSSTLVSFKAKKNIIYNHPKNTSQNQNFQEKKQFKIYYPINELLIKGKNIYEPKNNFGFSMTPNLKYSPLMTISYF